MESFRCHPLSHGIHRSPRQSYRRQGKSKLGQKVSYCPDQQSYRNSIINTIFRTQPPLHIRLSYFSIYSTIYINRRIRSIRITHPSLSTIQLIQFAPSDTCLVPHQLTLPSPYIQHGACDKWPLRNLITSKSQISYNQYLCGGQWLDAEVCNYICTLSRRSRTPHKRNVWIRKLFPWCMLAWHWILDWYWI